MTWMIRAGIPTRQISPGARRRAGGSVTYSSSGSARPRATTPFQHEPSASGSISHQGQRTLTYASSTPMTTVGVNGQEMRSTSPTR
ncbi:hypothetical protein ADK66_04660 [Micromonospora sp. NRRL B-16802]|nr:hypothetical protein ADK66_04660 [Micromonospora sp. NRRL B-16802]